MIYFRTYGGKEGICLCEKMFFLLPECYVLWRVNVFPIRNFSTSFLVLFALDSWLMQTIHQITAKKKLHSLTGIFLKYSSHYLEGLSQILVLYNRKTLTVRCPIPPA